MRFAAPVPGWWKFRARLRASSTSTTCCQVSASTIAGHTAFTCIFEVFARVPSGRIGRYSRTALLEGFSKISFRVRSVHLQPCIVEMPRWFQSVRIRYSDSPANTR